MPRGGARPNTGPKPQPKLATLALKLPPDASPMQVLLEVMRSDATDVATRIRIAQSLLPYHAPRYDELPKGSVAARAAAVAVTAHENTSWAEFLDLPEAPAPKPKPLRATGRPKQPEASTWEDLLGDDKPTSN